MENSTDILTELKELSPVVAAIEKINVFDVPQGYFENLHIDIMTGIENEMGLEKFEPVSVKAAVPPGYFDSLANNVLAKIKAMDRDDAAAELSALSPLLQGLQQKNVFKVPSGYFDNLPEIVLQKANPQPKVISIFGRNSTFIKYAVAAVFTGLMALTVIKFTAPALEIDLPDYVTAGLQVQDIDRELAGISEAEIVKFLESGDADIKTAFVANSIDENELPAQEDYLFDEKALDNYLNSINADAFKN